MDIPDDEYRGPPEVPNPLVERMERIINTLWRRFSRETGQTLRADQSLPFLITLSLSNGPENFTGRMSPRSAGFPMFVSIERPMNDDELATFEQAIHEDGTCLTIVRPERCRVVREIADSPLPQIEHVFDIDGKTGTIEETHDMAGLVEDDEAEEVIVIPLARDPTIFICLLDTLERGDVDFSKSIELSRADEARMGRDAVDDDGGSVLGLIVKAVREDQAEARRGLPRRGLRIVPKDEE